MIRFSTGILSQSTTLHNRLWPTNIMPVDDKIQPFQQHSLDENQLLCTSYRSTSYGYILFNDEDDGYRIFWIESQRRECIKNQKTLSFVKGAESMFNIQPERSDIMEQCHGTLQEAYIDPLTGYTQQPYPERKERDSNESYPDDLDDCVNIVFEAYLHVDALLSDILHRRKDSLFHGSNDHKISLPDYYYSIVSFNSTNGRSLKLVITFANPVVKRKVASYAILIEVDLFDQSYKECEWLAHSSLYDSEFLCKRSTILAMRYRMMETQMGPFSIVDTTLIEKLRVRGQCLDDIVSSSENYDSDIFEHEDAIDEQLWKTYVSSILMKDTIPLDAPSCISMSTLHLCDIVGNDAVVNRCPVAKLQSKEFPIEIVY